MGVLTPTAPDTRSDSARSGGRVRLRRVVRSRARSSAPDALGILTAYAVLLFLIPSNLVVGPLGAAGTPAGILGLVILVWWLNARQVFGLGVSRTFQPVRLIVFVYGGVVMASYAAACVRPTYGAEMRSANRALLTVAGLIGVTVVAADAIRTMDNLVRFVRRIVGLAAVISMIGVVQFATGFDPTTYLRLPGLSLNSARFAYFNYSFRRVAGTAGHPIEFGVTLAMCLPLAVWNWLDTPDGSRGRWRASVALIAVAIPMSLSRSAFLGLFFGGLMMLGGWSWKRRRDAVVTLGIYAVAMRLMVPGLLGTVKSLFLNLRSDPSFKGRTEDYSHIYAYIRQRPFFGRGVDTFLPSIYILLDNQYLGTILEMGFIGLAALILLFVIGIGCARGARRRAMDESERQLGQAFAASMLVAMTSFITFDAMSFAMVRGLVFLLLGGCGAIWRLTRERDVDTPTTHGQGQRAYAWQP